MNGTLKELTFNRDGTQNVTVTVTSDFREMFDELKDQQVSVEIKKASRHRSLTANAYAWVLIDQIAARQQNLEPDGGWTPEKVYRDAIREIGGVAEFLGIREAAYKTFENLWCHGHLGRQCEIIPGSTKSGWVNVKAWRGSSDFDSEQMTRLIENLIQDAESLGIPTISPREEAQLLERWGRRIARDREGGDQNGKKEPAAG